MYCRRLVVAIADWCCPSTVMNALYLSLVMSPTPAVTAPRNWLPSPLYVVPPVAVAVTPVYCWRRMMLTTPATASEP